ncbi:DUF3349 domain-containing protein [Aestuariimicrobium soli]|uniref:DUF3349 domain-containing protein n=1 Tax=Aestuariimicrobium soli TaxID=2035834 RepID=UPI003EB84E05
MGDSIISKVVGWLTAGYPQGVPAQDMLPLLEVLRRRLTPGEVDDVAQRLAEAQVVPVTAEQIREMVLTVVREQPSDDDVHRVASHLALGGWPLATADFGRPEA